MQYFFGSLKNICRDIYYEVVPQKDAYIAKNTIIGKHVNESNYNSYQKKLIASGKPELTSDEKISLVWAYSGSFDYSDDSDVIVIVTNKRIIKLDRYDTDYVLLSNIMSIKHEEMDIFHSDLLICVLNNYKTKMFRIFHNDACKCITMVLNKYLHKKNNKNNRIIPTNTESKSVDVPELDSELFGELCEIKISDTNKLTNLFPDDNILTNDNKPWPKFPTENIDILTNDDNKPWPKFPTENIDILTNDDDDNKPWPKFPNENIDILTNDDDDTWQNV
jgi:hypothetical protein